MFDLHLVRHGESTWNTLGLAQGHNDLAELTSRGLRQAAETAARFSGHPVRALYASDLRRALQTAAAFAGVLGLPVFADGRLRERSLGVLEGTAAMAIDPALTGLAGGRVTDPDARPAGGESVRDLYQRAAGFAEELAAAHDEDGGDQAGDVVVVAHGGTLRVLEAYLTGVPVGQMAWPPLENARVLRIPGYVMQSHLKSRGGIRMTPSALLLPRRAVKPRETGLTMVIDGGVPLGQFTDQIELGAEYINYVKFGWGTSIVTNCLREKIAVLEDSDIGFYFGGTLFEKFVLQGRFEDYRRFCEQHGARHVEVSNGTIDMSNAEKAGYVRKLAADFTVVSEVGFKDPGRSELLPPSEWIACISEDLDAGAALVTLEARESGKSGICRADGALRDGLVEDVLNAGIPERHLLFEAPTSALQTHLITRIGPDVNLGNVPAQGVISTETLRLGLRADTLTVFERG